MSFERQIPWWWGYAYLDGVHQLRQNKPSDEEWTKAKANPLIIHIVEPFIASTRTEAAAVLIDKIKLQGRQTI